MASVQLANVTKEYIPGAAAVSGLTLDVADGELMVLVGPSGCGKSTALRMIAGLESITEGDLLIGGERMNDVASHERDIAMVFQSYALYPHLTVGENMGFSLRVARVPKRERTKRVRAVARTLGLDELIDRKPRELSGGQRQRVAMGRAIIREPQVFLMDEPLSNLDAKLRSEMRAEISDLQARLGVTTIFVTHDQVEAMTMGHRVAVLREGELQQVAAPDELYRHPANLFVASFIGNPSMSILRFSVEAEARRLAAGVARLDIPEPVLARRPGLLGTAEALVGLRPEHLRLVGESETGNALDGTVRGVEALGSDTFVRVECAAGDDRPEAPDRADEESPAPAPTVTVREPGSASVRPGQRCRVAVNLDEAHFFDPAGDPIG